jgi:hypothetical protein
MTAMHYSKLSTASIFRATVLSLIGMCLIMPYGAGAQCAPEPVTGVQGMVFQEGADQPAAVAGAKIIIQGDFMILSANTDHEGKFSFSNIEPGTYIVEAAYFGLHAEQKITVEAGSELQVALHLKLPAAKP